MTYHSPVTLLQDAYGRTIRDLRLSVTDRCNFQCLYCLPMKVPHLPRAHILTFDEIERLARLFVGFGVHKLRLTGGEPLVRHDFVKLVERLARLKDEGLQELAMTSNGFLLPPLARSLRDAGLDRLNLSCDSLDPEGFRRMTGQDGLERVFAALDAAREAGFQGTKLNCVVIRGLNEHEVADFAAFAQDTGTIVRFIEFMPLDSGQEWGRDKVVPRTEILERIGERFPLEEIPPRHPAETARRYRLPGGAEIGVIASVTSPFCGRCNRLRLTADGQLRTCLFSLKEHDLKTPMREGLDEEGLAALVRHAVFGKEPGHRINEEDYVQPDRTMVGIGG